MKVSVIVRTKNREHLLEEAVKSILNQTYEKFEIVIVNDGEELNAKFFEKFSDENITYFKTKSPLGRANALNKGIELSNGELICFLDDDDIYYENALSDMVSTFKRYQTVVFGKIICKKIDIHNYNAFRIIRTYGEPFDRIKILIENYITFNSLLIPKKTFDEVGLFDDYFEVYEDWEWLCRLSKRHNPVFFDKILGEYRVFEENTVTGKEGEEYYEKFKNKIYDLNFDIITPSEVSRYIRLSKANYLAEFEKDKSILLEILADKENSLSFLKDIISEKDKQLENNNSYIMKLEKELKAKNSYIMELQKELEDKNTFIAKLEEELSYKNSQLADAIKKNKEIYNEFKELQNYCQTVENQLEEAKFFNLNLSKQVESLRSSIFYKFYKKLKK